VNQSFSVSWKSSQREKDAVSPGLSSKITVQYRPTTNETINDLLIIIAEGDGALIVPLLTASSTPPVLESAFHR